MDLVSVIVPVYKVEKYLDRCVESIINQTYRNLEIILVDDGSPDHCPAMCDTWAERDSRIRVIHKANGGLSDARNTGMSVANGEYISFIDSDDWIAPRFYEKLLEAIERDGSDIATCTVEMLWEDGAPPKMLTEKINCVLVPNEAQAELLAEHKLKQPVWYKLYRTSLVKNIPFEKGKYHEDVFWSYQAVGTAKKISVLDYVGYYYWQRKGSIMGEGYSIRRLDRVEAICRRYEYFEKYFPELKEAALSAVWGECIYQGQMAMTYLNKENQKKVFSRLNSIQRKYPIRYRDYCNMKVTHQLWISAARISLPMVCWIKKTLKVGF